VTGTLTRPDIPPNDPDLLALSLLSGVPTFDELAAIDPTDDCEPF
jgi:hypothetical protein